MIIGAPKTGPVQRASSRLATATEWLPSRHPRLEACWSPASHRVLGWPVGTFQKADFSFPNAKLSRNLLQQQRLAGTAAGSQPICPTALITPLLRHGVEYMTRICLLATLGRNVRGIAEVSASRRSEAITASKCSRGYVALCPPLLTLLQFLYDWGAASFWICDFGWVIRPLSVALSPLWRPVP
jgi:hypothetical protein